MISKELLSEVLGVYLVMRPITERNYIGYLISSNGIPNTPDAVKNDHKRINIYELAHKCKEWARDNKYNTFTSFTYETMCWLDKKEEWICRIDKGSQEHDFFADTEPEAIFKACEWIKDNK